MCSADAQNIAVGKQRLKPEGIWYTTNSGIWQTVWLEPVSLSPHQHGYYWHDYCPICQSTAFWNMHVEPKRLLLEARRQSVMIIIIVLIIFIVVAIMIIVTTTITIASTITTTTNAAQVVVCTTATQWWLLHADLLQIYSTALALLHTTALGTPVLTCWTSVDA